MNRVTLGDICEKASSNIVQKDLDGNEGEYPIYGASGYIKNVNFYHQTEPYIAIVKDGAGIGRTMLLPAKSSVIGTMQYILPKEDKDIDIDYLYYAIVHMNLGKYFSGATIPHIYFKDYQKESLNLPDRYEQQHIASIFKKIDVLISNTQEQTKHFDELIKARFIEMFGNLVIGDKINTNKKRIGEIASVTKLAGFEFTKYIQYKEQGEIIMLRGLNCKKGHLVLDDIKWIDKETSDLLPRSKLYYGDILMTYAGTIGDVAMVDEDNKYHLAPNVAKITLNDKNLYNPIFLMYLFMYTNDYIMTFASKVAQPSINMEKIRNFEYYFPSIEMQNEFENLVKQIDKSKLVLEKRLQDLEILKKSLMQQYFG